MTNKTNGQVFAKRIASCLSISANTNRYRSRRDLHRDIVEMVVAAATDPGCFPLQVAVDLALGIAPVRAYRKHVLGSRIDGAKIAKIQAMTPCQFIEHLAAMIDAGITNVGMAEDFYREMAV